MSEMIQLKSLIGKREELTGEESITEHSALDTQHYGCFSRFHSHAPQREDGQDLLAQPRRACRIRQVLRTASSRIP